MRKNLKLSTFVYALTMDRNAEKELKNEINSLDKQIETDAIYFKRELANLTQEIETTSKKIEKNVKTYNTLCAEKEA